MKFLLWGIWLAVVAIMVAIGLRHSQGWVVVLAPPWRVDLSLNFCAVLVAVLLWTAYLLGRIAQRLGDFPERVRAYRERRSELGALRGLRAAVKALMEGRFARAERAARRAQSAPAVAALAALLGARAAHRLQEYQRREQWLARAEADSELGTARLILSAEMWSEQRDSARTLQMIAQLHQAGARHIHALRIALTAHLQSCHWNDALRIIRVLDKHRGLSAAASKAYRITAYRGLLRDHAGDAQALEQAWSRIPAADRLAPDLVLDVARAFNGLGRGIDAAQALEQSLRAQWNEALLEQYAACAELSPALAISQMESWMREHGRSALSLLCLGRICLRAQLWGKAGAFLEESQRLEPRPETALALAQWAEAVGNGALAAERFRAAALGLVQRAEHRPAAPPRGFRREPTL